MKVVAPGLRKQGLSPNHVEKKLIVSARPVCSCKDHGLYFRIALFTNEKQPDCFDMDNQRPAVRELEASRHYLSSRKIGQSFYLVANKNIYYYPARKLTSQDHYTGIQQSGWFCCH